MIVQILGLLDLTASVLHILLRWNIGVKLALIAGTLLLLKSLIFMKNIASFIDLLSAVFLLLPIFGVSYSYVNIFFSLWLLQKAMFSFAPGHH